MEKKNKSVFTALSCVFNHIAKLESELKKLKDDLLEIEDFVQEKWKE